MKFILSIFLALGLMLSNAYAQIGGGGVSGFTLPIPSPGKCVVGSADGLKWITDDCSVSTAMARNALNGTLPDALKNLGDPIFYAQNYGVVTGSLADQSAQIQSALTACDANGGGVVVLAIGIFFAKELTLSNFCHLVGQGRSDSNPYQGSVIKLPNGANTYIIASSTYISNSVAGNQYQSLKHLTLDGNGVNNLASTAPLVIWRTYESTIEDSNIQYGTARGILFTSLSANNTETAGILANNRIINSKFINNGGAALYAQNGANPRTTDLYLQNNIFKQNATAATECQLEAEWSNGWWVSGNGFFAAPKCEMNLQKAGSTRILNNEFDAYLNVANGTDINSVTISPFGWGDVFVSSNTIHTEAASLGTATGWNLLRIVQESQTAGVVVVGNDFRSNNFAVNSIVGSGTHISEYPVTVGSNSFNNFALPPLPSSSIVLTTSSIERFGSPSVAQNTTGYIAPGAYTTNGGQTPGAIELNGTTLFGLAVGTQNPPAAGQTYTFTLTKEPTYNGLGADTAITCTITGPAGQYCTDIINLATVAAGGVWQMRVVTSATSGSTGVINASVGVNRHK